MANKREFRLEIDPIVFRSAPAPDKGIRSIEITKGLYFYTARKASNISGVQQTEVRLANTMSHHILNLIEKEVQRLMKFWYDNVNLYFNRRATGIAGMGPIRSKLPQRGRVKTKYIANTRQHTGQLRRSIAVRSINIHGADLYARAVHAKTDNRDYIDILIKGAHGGTGAYNPSFDLRMKHGKWGGITPAYWAHWQSRFMREIKASEVRLQHQIETYITKMTGLGAKEIRAARSVRHNKEFIKEVVSKERNFSIEFKKPKYSKDRGELEFEPYPEDQTWEGMKARYYADKIALEPDLMGAPLNEVIRRSRINFGRGR